MKNLICALILLIASPVSATTIVLTDGQKIETGNCSIMQDGFIQCTGGERTQRIPLKAVQKIIRNDGSVLDQSALSQLAKGQKNTAKSDIPSDETLALLYKEAVQAIRELKRDTNSQEILDTSKAHRILLKCRDAFNARKFKDFDLSPNESAALKRFDKAYNGFLKLAKEQKGNTKVEALAAQGAFYMGALSMKVVWDARIRHENLNIAIEKIDSRYEP